MIYKGKELKTYDEIIDYALKLKGKPLAAFVKAYAKTSPYALSNIGYISGYYGPAKMAKIQRVFKTAHPLFGRTQPTAKKAFRAGVMMGARARHCGILDGDGVKP